MLKYLTMCNQNIRVRLILINKGKLLLMHDSKVGFYYYPGGHVEFGETLLQAAKRECLEECDTDFEFEKILYIRDFFSKDSKEHALEIFILGKLKNWNAGNSKDPSGRDTQSLEWFDMGKLPKNLYPKNLSKRIFKDYKKDFPCQGEYVGIIQ